MDPDELLESLTELARKVISDIDEDEGPVLWEDRAEELASKVLALDTWMRRGGFPPRAWNRKQQTEKGN